MTKTPLRAYLRDIEDAIKENQTDEAVAHCRHILKTFPKHIDTYRLLGKAYLEAQRYSSAADIFERVLSAIPDDFIAHLGMSIIREDEGNLGAALWNMERAFEVQPYNAAIQGELRRLYGKRDGMEPTKARLTHGALARTYAKGGHYQQAIAELRTTLTEDPKRADLLVLLAEMHKRNGDTVKAIETCSTLLRDLPYCLQANRILAELLEGTERQNDRQACLQRLHALDPYEAYISDHAPFAVDVPDQAVTIEHLAWDGSSVGAAQPSWAASLEVDLEEADSPASGVPNWLASASDDDLTPEAAPSEREIPEWMQDAGWEPATGEFQEGPSPFASDKEDEPASAAVEADLPDWIKDMAPAAAAATGLAADELLSDDDASTLDALFDDDNVADDGVIPDWMQSETPADEAAPTSQDTEESAPDETPIAQPDPAADGMPDWLKGIDHEEDRQPAEEGLPAEKESTGVTDFLNSLRDEESEEPKEPAAPAAEAALPDWLQDTIESPAPTQPEEEPQAVIEETPDWLQDTAKIAPPDVDEEPTAETQVVADEREDMPDWLQSLEDTTTTVTEPEPEPEAPTKEEAIPDWLDELAGDVLAKDEQTPAAEEAPETPDWLTDLSEAAQPEDTPPPTRREMAANALEIETDDEPVYPQIDDLLEEAKPEPESEYPEWLAPSVETEDTLEPVAAKGNDSDFPEWLPSPSEAEPAPPADEVEEATPEFADADAAMAWLESLAAKQGVPEEELLTSPDERPKEPPEWAQESSPEAKAKPESAVPTPPTPDAAPDDIPDWLQEGAFAEPESAETPAPQIVEPEEPAPSAEVAEETTPEWMTDMTAESAEPSVDETPASEEIPAWLQDLDEESPTPEPEPQKDAAWVEADEESPELEQEEAPDWIKDMQRVDEVEEPASPKAKEAAPEEELPDWLKDVDEEPLEDPTWIREFDRQPEEEITPKAEAAPKDDELPDWLKDADKDSDLPAWALDAAEDKEYTWQPSDEEAQPEKLDLNQASLIELERLPGMGFRKAQIIFSHRDTHGNYNALDDILTLPEFDSATVEGLRDYLEVLAPAAEETPPPAESAPLTPVMDMPEGQPEDEHHARQMDAQTHFAQGNISEALEHYAQLIKKGKRIEAVVADLERASEQRPMDTEILQALGDAYMRADQLQEALDTFSRIEKLLQMK